MYKENGTFERFVKKFSCSSNALFRASFSLVRFTVRYPTPQPTPWPQSVAVKPILQRGSLTCAAFYPHSKSTRWRPQGGDVR
jgi:hypothetical protein